MGKRYIAKNVECPFYHSEDQQKIYCDGVGVGTSLHLAFGSKTDLKKYKEAYCINCYEKCDIARMLYRKSQEGEA